MWCAERGCDLDNGDNRCTSVNLPIMNSNFTGYQWSFSYQVNHISLYCVPKLSRVSEDWTSKIPGCRTNGSQYTEPTSLTIENLGTLYTAFQCELCQNFKSRSQTAYTSDRS